MSVQSLEQQLRAASCKQDFLKACANFATPDVLIDADALNAYASSLIKPAFLSPWKEYLTPNQAPHLDFVELAVSTVLQGGFLYADANGHVKKWEIDGSGAKALLSVMDKVRAASSIPGVNLVDAEDAKTKLATTFGGTPFADERLNIWTQLSSPESLHSLLDVYHSARRLQDDGRFTFHFTFEDLRTLAKICPEGFGEDPYLKKAALLPILFAGVAHNKIAPQSVTMDLIIPADYRVPQTLHNAGILRFSDRLAAKLESGILFAEDDADVAQIRVKTIEAIEAILQKRPDLQLPEIDGELWFAGRLFDADAATLTGKKAAIRTALESIRDSSSFATPGFQSRTSKPMNVSTLRF